MIATWCLIVTALAADAKTWALYEATLRTTSEYSFELADEPGVHPRALEVFDTQWRVGAHMAEDYIELELEHGAIVGAMPLHRPRGITRVEGAWRHTQWVVLSFTGPLGLQADDLAPHLRGFLMLNEIGERRPVLQIETSERKHAVLEITPKEIRAIREGSWGGIKRLRETAIDTVRQLGGGAKGVTLRAWVGEWPVPPWESLVYRSEIAPAELRRWRSQAGISSAIR